MTNKKLLLGDEAIAQAAIDAGIAGVYAYPGTPSTEITEYIQAFVEESGEKIHCKWSANEKTAMETALGMSFVGKRAIVCMKHVGLNVAMDPFTNSAITGCNGGLIYVIADDPSMHSSQDEQDSRALAKFAFLPCFEPSNQQEAYDMVFDAFEMSENLKIPVTMRITTRMAHSRAVVKCKVQNEKCKTISLPKDPMQFILLPANARRQYAQLLTKQTELIEIADNSPYNKLIINQKSILGIVSCGIAYNYLMENFPDTCPYSVLKVSQYPFPEKLFMELAENCDEILFLEEGYPVYEEYASYVLSKMQNAKCKIFGRLNGYVPRAGELNANIVQNVKCKMQNHESILNPQFPILNSEVIVSRPPSLCPGCPHIDSYNALNEVMNEYGKFRVFSDIGCYTLGALPPYSAIYSTVDMGASITMAKGASDAGLDHCVAIIGDSTFCHSGMTGLLDCVIENTPITVIILDNSTTGMTGGQDSHAFGRLYEIVKGLGVEENHIRICVPLRKNHEELVKIIREEIEHQGVSVIIPQRECIQTARRKK
ncbi:indolepyruvate oxidoreductase subunit IorA [Bacteroidia bacterium]|nr:indolepyruvate oxidoreductase subunit IorA [Bacteroidia bacterium]